MKTVKRPPLEDVRQNSTTTSKKVSKMIRVKQSSLNGKLHHTIKKKKKDKQPKKFSIKVKGIKISAMQPCIPLIRVDDGIAAAAESASKMELSEVLAITRSLIGSLLIYPNMLGHEDFHCLRKLLQDFLVVFKWDTTEVQVPLQPSDDTSLVAVNPPLPKNDTPILFPAVFIQDMVVDPVEKIAHIRQYALMPSMSQALHNLVSTIYKTPKILYEESHTFLYEFLVRFGAKPRYIEKFVQGKSNWYNHRIARRLMKITRKKKSKRSNKCTVESLYSVPENHRLSCISSYQKVICQNNRKVNSVSCSLVYLN